MDIIEEQPFDPRKFPLNHKPQEHVPKIKDKFKCSMRRFKSVLKQKTWDVVRFNTNSPFQYRLKEYYDLKGVYQVGKNIYNLETNELLGTFTETDKLSSINYLGVTYSYYPQQPYYKDPELFKKLDEAKVVQLEVLIGGFAFDDRVTLDDPNVDLLTKYKIGVEILITQNPSANIYLDDNYLEDYLD